MAQAGEQLATQADRLLRGGARTVFVLTMPEPATLLFSRGLPSGVLATLTILATKFNETLAQAASTMSGVTVVDIGPLMTELLTQPTRHGIVEVNRPACNIPSAEDPQALFCSAQTLVEPDAADRFLFADGVHLTSAGNRAKAGYVLEQLGAIQDR